MKKYILIGLMGAAGALCRYCISMLFTGTFPWGTLMVNLLGCLLLPFIFILIRELPFFSNDLVNAMGTGFVGAFTTFSSFSVEIIRLIEGGNPSKSLFYLLISTSGGLLAAYSSVIFSNYVIRKLKDQKAV
jgi:CrcB protein